MRRTFFVFFSRFSMQLQLISDYHSIDGIANIQTNAIYETDYYVLIMDNFTKVGVLSSVKSFLFFAKYIQINAVFLL